jgi:hypothetical protein
MNAPALKLAGQAAATPGVLKLAPAQLMMRPAIVGVICTTGYCRIKGSEG